MGSEVPSGLCIYSARCLSSLDLPSVTVTTHSRGLLSPVYAPSPPSTEVTVFPSCSHLGLGSGVGVGARAMSAGLDSVLGPNDNSSLTERLRVSDDQVSRNPHFTKEDSQARWGRPTVINQLRPVWTQRPQPFSPAHPVLSLSPPLNCEPWRGFSFVPSLGGTGRGEGNCSLCISSPRLVRF